MHIQYYLANGQEIDHVTPGQWPGMDDINAVALQYAMKRQDVLPQYLYVSVRIYTQVMHSLGGYIGMFNIVSMGNSALYINTAAGPIAVKVMPWASDAKLLLIGNEDDFERYDLDKIFEEVVLKDCERI